jgi:hypothetical protein
MGASSWRYYTAYQSDPEAALQQLRRDVFARGEYSMGFGGFAGPGGPFAGAAGFPGIGHAGPGGTGPAGDLFTAAGRMAGMSDRVIRAALTGDSAGLNEEEQRAAEQLGPLLEMARTQLAAAGAFDNLGDDDGEEDDFDDEEGGTFPPGHRPQTIEELLEMVGEEGTHSVLDIEHTGPRREFGVAAPMSSRQVARFFGSERPTREQLEEHWADASDGLERWQAYYVTVYRDGNPHEYAFIGCSGD